MLRHDLRLPRLGGAQHLAEPLLRFLNLPAHSVTTPV
jgi:hypothetical protein